MKAPSSARTRAARPSGRLDSAAKSETFDTLRARIGARYDALSPHLQRIARAALEDPNRFAIQTIAAIADTTQVQPSGLIRFAREFGYAGFSALQQVFKLRLIEGAAAQRERVYEAHAGQATKPGDVMRNLAACVDDMTASLSRLKKAVAPKDLARAVDLLRGADHVYVAGLRRSRPIAAYLAYGLMRVERPCSLLDFDGGMAGQQVANMKPGDVLAAIAFAEYAAPVVEAVRDAYLRGIPVIAITDVEASPLARSAAIRFLFDDMPIAPFRPISGPLALVQAMVVTLGRT